MILTRSLEQAIRMVEAMNALSAVLPLYDPEMRSSFKAISGQDLARLIPAVFMDLGRACAGHQKAMNQYLDYVEELIHYVRGRTDQLPKPSMDYDVDTWIRDSRGAAERLVKSWRVVEDPKQEERPDHD